MGRLQGKVAVILSTASVAGLVGLARSSAYSDTKAGVIGLSRAAYVTGVPFVVDGGYVAG